MGRVAVSIGGGAAKGSARTIAPDTSEFTKYTLTFSGPEGDTANPVDTDDGSATVALPAGLWTISVTGYTGAEGSYVEAAQGSASVNIVAGYTGTVNILLGPKTGGAQGTFGFSLSIPYGLESSELIITTATGDPVETITLSYSFAGIEGSTSLDPGEYLVRIRLQKGTGDAASYAGLTEALHIYPGLTSALPEQEFEEDDFKTAVGEFDLSGKVTAPVFWAEPLAAFTETSQYTGSVAWKESDGSPLVTGVFRGGTVYKAVVTLSAKTDYTFTGVAANSFTFTGATGVTNSADSGVVTIEFPATETQTITGVAVAPSAPSVSQGGTQTFAATVTGTVEPPQTVTWTVEGNYDDGTAIAADGTLTVAINESAASLTVKAVSVADPSKDATAAVTVTAASVINIGSVAELAKIGVDPSYPLGGRYKLTANLTLSNWAPIGDSSAPFFGVFDGDDNTITLQDFDAAAVSERAYLGIFGYVKGGSAASKAKIKGLTIQSALNQSSDFAGRQVIGTLAGYAENTDIEQITLGGSFAFSSTKTIYLGGIAGYLQQGAVVKNSNVSADLAVTTGNSTGATNIPGTAAQAYSYVGGVAGIFVGGGEILGCHNTGDIQAYSEVAGSQIFAGGIAGGSYYSNTGCHGKIEDCSYAGDLHAKAKGFWTFAGGIAGTIAGGGGGDNPTRIVRSFATGAVSVAGTSSGNPYIGGIVGYNYFGARVSQCYFTGTVTADKSGDYTGGIAGYNSQTGAPNNSTIEDCWSTGIVTGFNNAGGIVGQNQINTYVRRCYSTAIVIASNTGATGVGGIAGMNASAMTNALTGNVALNPSIQGGNTANIHRVVGGGSSTQNINNLGWSGMTVITGGTYTPAVGANLKDGAAIAVQPSAADYAALGWNFDSVWEMDAYGYPKLQWQTADTPRAPLAGPVPVVQVENYNHYEGSTYTTNAGGKLTVSWKPVPGASSYDIYYAPRVTDAPAMPGAAAATGETGTSKVFADNTIGKNTMNYYVWIKANNSVGSSKASAPTGSLDRFLGTWTDGTNGGMDGFSITNADMTYLMLWAGYMDEDYDGEYDVLSYIRAVVPFEGGSETVEFNDKAGPAGIIVVEYDRSVDGNLMWSHKENNYFNALYYYGLNAGETRRSAYLGFAADLAGTYGSPDYGCDVAGVNEAITKFTFADMDDYVSPGVAAIYNWEAED
jgi:hypothetical protein